LRWIDAPKGVHEGHHEDEVCGKGASRFGEAVVWQAGQTGKGLVAKREGKESESKRIRLVCEIGSEPERGYRREKQGKKTPRTHGICSVVGSGSFRFLTQIPVPLLEV